MDNNILSDSALRSMNRKTRRKYRKIVGLSIPKFTKAESERITEEISKNVYKYNWDKKPVTE